MARAISSTIRSGSSRISNLVYRKIRQPAATRRVIRPASRSTRSGSVWSAPSYSIPTRYAG